MLSMGPYFPPEYDGPPPPPVHPAQPGLLLLTLALIVVVALVTREILRRRRRASDRVVDDLTITWLPAEAVDRARDLADGDCVWSEAEELSFGPIRRTPRTARQRTPS